MQRYVRVGHLVLDETQKMDFQSIELRAGGVSWRLIVASLDRRHGARAARPQHAVRASTAARIEAGSTARCVVPVAR
jgi:hypothetical protein